DRAAVRRTAGAVPGVDAEEDGTPGGAQRIPHHRERAQRPLALVVLEIVDAPGGERLRVGGLVAEAADGDRGADAAVDPDAGLVVRRLVDSQLQALAMNVGGQRGNPGREL